MTTTRTYLVPVHELRDRLSAAAGEVDPDKSAEDLALLAAELIDELSRWRTLLMQSVGTPDGHKAHIVIGPGAELALKVDPADAH